MHMPMTRPPGVRAKAALAAAGLAATAWLLPATTAGGATTSTPRAEMIDTNGVRLGTVAFRVVEGKMAVDVTVKLPPQFAGFRGFHLHRVGRCDPRAVDASGARSPFFTAGGHIGSEDGHSHAGHDGDLPSLLINRDGLARMVVRTDHVSFDRLFDADGTAVMIHAAPDNFGHIPTRYSATGPDAATLATGDAGARVVCGVLKR